MTTIQTCVSFGALSQGIKKVQLVNNSSNPWQEHYILHINMQNRTERVPPLMPWPHQKERCLYVKSIKSINRSVYHCLILVYGTYCLESSKGEMSAGSNAGFNTKKYIFHFLIQQNNLSSEENELK